jgi:hypothetical protein
VRYQIWTGGLRPPLSIAFTINFDDRYGTYTRVQEFAEAARGHAYYYLLLITINFADRYGMRLPFIEMNPAQYGQPGITCRHEGGF